MTTSTPFHIPFGQRQLFVDDHGVAAVEHLVRTMHQPQKQGAVIEPDYPRETSIQSRSMPAWVPEDRCYKLWIMGEGGISYAESGDGLTWTRPILRCREHKGSLENSLVSGPCGEHVIYDPADPDPSRRYKGLRLRGSGERAVSPSRANWKLVHNPWRLAYPEGHVLNDSSVYQLSWVIHVTERSGADPGERFEGRGCFQTRDIVVSADGIHWRKLDRPGLPTGDEGNLSYDEVTGTYIATLKEGEMSPRGRSITLATSKDFEHWTSPELVFHADEEDQELARQAIAARLADPGLIQPQHNVPEEYFVDVYNMSVFRYEGLYLGMPAFFHHSGDVDENSDGFHHVQLTCSRDLHHWERLGQRRPFIGPSRVGSGAYDLSQIMPPTRPVLAGDELRLYYMGAKYRTAPPDPDPITSAICLATLRRDGFVSLDAGDHAGTLLTEPFLLKSPWLFANVDAASFQAEVLDASGKSVARSHTLSGDHSRFPLQWEEGSLESLHYHFVQLRFTLKQGSFYSYWFEENPEPPPH